MFADDGQWLISLRQGRLKTFFCLWCQPRLAMPLSACSLDLTSLLLEGGEGVLA